MNQQGVTTFFDTATGRVEESMGYLMKRITVAMRRGIDRRMAAHGLTAAQWMPLWRLANDKGLSGQALACALGMDAGSVARMVERLVAKGLVVRERRADDRRVVQIELTDEGRVAVEAMRSVLAEANNLALRGFSEAEFAQLMSYLRRIDATVSAEPSNE